jgi:hypothetical protein
MRDLPACLELIGVPTGEIDVLATVLDRFADVSAFAEFISGLDG